jgi:hypothetical protein
MFYDFEDFFDVIKMLVVLVLTKWGGGYEV